MRYRISPLILTLVLLVTMMGPTVSSAPEQPDALPYFEAWPTPSPSPVATATPSPTPSPSPSPSPSPTKKPYEAFTLSFAGDCTLGADLSVQSESRSFMAVVGENYAYPFLECQPWFGTDDFTLVNFEGTLTESTLAQDKTFRFKGPPGYVQCLTQGSVEGVSLANNHSLDYGEQGLADTTAALGAANIAYATKEEPFVYDTGRGLVIGVYGGFSSGRSEKRVRAGIEALREMGANYIICAFHFGEEGDYLPSSEQERTARSAIDLGADLVIGHHPHVLQRVERYKGKVIAYSLGNFCFGGNQRPNDMDTVIMQQRLHLYPDGQIQDGGSQFIPFRMSGFAISDTRNDFQPQPYPEEDIGYARVLEKLGVTGDGEILSVAYDD